MRIGKKEKELAEVNACRVANGMRPIQTGIRKCLKCGEEFESWDMINHRICDACKIINEEINDYSSGTITIQIDDEEEGMYGHNMLC